MPRYYRIPLLFLLLAALLGLFLRWQPVVPTPGIRYTFFLHAHSHMMFLGWVFNVLYLSFTDHNLPDQKRKRSRTIFFVLQPMVVAMMISFPIEGYGLFSIVFSTLHTLVALAFIPWFFRNTKTDKRVSTWFARIAWIFFFISTAGPFSLGYLMANGLGQTVWYNFSIYFYLHFQYNGFFLFGIFSLFFQLLERKEIVFSHSAARAVGQWMAIACVPAYALSVLYADPSPVLNIVGAAAAFCQIIVLGFFLTELKKIKVAMQQKFMRITYPVFYISFIALILKSILQLASAHPVIAEFAYLVRPVVIAYLHLVLVGVITLFLLGWYIEKKMVQPFLGKVSIAVLLVGFTGSQICLVLAPWWSTVFGDRVTSSSVILAFSVLMALGCALFYSSFIKQPSVTQG